ncbi:MAG: FtsX-like permease family protein, partial [Candidatus Micrarchaeota archaeon]
PEEVFGIFVQVKAGQDPGAVAKEIEEELRDYRGVEEGSEDFSVSTSEQLMETFSMIFGVVQAVILGIAAISLLVGGIGIMNTMYTSVLERTKEIGIMKAIGARNGDILTIFLIESASLGLFGGIIGVLLGAGLSKIAEVMAIQATGSTYFVAAISTDLVVGALLFSTIIGSIAGLLPARQAAKMKPVDALRYE